MTLFGIIISVSNEHPSKEELKIMMNLDYPYQIKDIALTSLATGMRQGEVLGLKWDDIDFENKEINIQNA